MKIRMAVLLAVLVAVGAWAVFADHSAAATPDPVVKSIAEFNTEMVGMSPEFIKQGKYTYALLTQSGARYIVPGEIARTRSLAHSILETRAAQSLDFTWLYFNSNQGKKVRNHCLAASSDVFGPVQFLNRFDADYKACTAN
jgi:hypothetical protein